MFEAGRVPVLMLVVATACGGPTPAAKDAPDDGFDRTALLTHLSKSVLLPMQTEFAARAAVLPAAIEAHCNALDAGDGSATLAPARAAFGMAIDAWQKADAVLVGPAAADMLTLRGRIYGWPNSSPCEVDRDVASRWADPSSYNVATELVSTRSLTAIELLLWPPSDSHNCFDLPIGWNDLGANLPRARCRLAHAIAVDVAAQAQTLASTWTASYADELAGAPNGQEALNHVSDGLFYLDKIVKDMKLGEAAGIALNACDVVQEPCLREVELRFADRATFAIRANLVGFREVFTGTTATQDGQGFDDWLVFAGHTELATRMTKSLDDAIAEANALPDSFLTALATNYADVTTLHESVKVLTDDLKSQFLTVLALEIPNDVATDND